MPDPQDYLATLVGRARRVLGEALVGAYAAGSLALDAYQPGRSDIDVALVVAAPLGEDVKRDLVAALRHETLPVPARGLELVVYTVAAAGAGQAAPLFEVELNTGPGMDFRATYDPAQRPREDGWFWYALDRSVLSGSHRSLLGPPAATVFADVSAQDLQRLLVEALGWWMQVPGDTVDAVLGACRSLVRFRDGVWLSKMAAGERVVAQGHPLASVVDEAVAARQGDGTAPAEEAARRFQRAVRDEIRPSIGPTA